MLCLIKRKNSIIYVSKGGHQGNKLRGGIIMSIQATVQKEVEKMQNTIKREAAIENEVQNYTAVMEHIAEMKEASEALPEETNFTSYDEWQADVEKKLKSKNSSLATIEKYKELIVAYQYYLEQNPIE